MQISYDTILEKFLQAGGKIRTKKSGKYDIRADSELGLLLRPELVKIMRFIQSQPRDLFGHQTVMVQDLVPFFSGERNPKSSAKVTLWNLEWMGYIQRMNAGEFSEMTVWKLI